MKTHVVRHGRICIRDQKGFARITVGNDSVNVFVLGGQDLHNLRKAWMHVDNVDVVKGHTP